MARRHSWVAALLIGSGLVAGVAGAVSAAAPFPAYVDDRGTWVLLSNAAWRASAVAHARELRPQAVLLSSGTEKSALVWAPTCTQGLQHIQLTRMVTLPGQPASVGFNLLPQAPAPVGSPAVLKAVELRVNGRRALVVGGGQLTRPNLLELQVPPAALDQFHLGQNRLDVEVTRGALPASVPTCNRSPQTLVGVAFGLEGRSAADLSVSPGKAPVQYVRGAVYQFNGVFTVHNAGPSAALGGTFAFRAQIGFLNGVIDPTIHPVKATAPFGACTTSGEPESGPLTVSCPFAVFPPGATATASLSMIVKIPADEPLAAVYQILADWSIVSHTATSTYSGTPDPVGENNTRSEVIYLCGPQATDAKCPAASG